MFGSSSAQGAGETSSSSAGPAAFGNEYTLDEPLWRTVQRDVMAIGRNLRSVLIPVDWKLAGHQAQLSNWDLWGPLIFMLTLAVTLSWNEKKASSVFSLVFTEVACGALVLTVNVILMGGDIVFFQARPP